MIAAALVDEAARCLAVPLLLTVEPVRGPDGVWRIRAEYPEFPGCEATSEMLTLAMDRLDDRRRELTLQLLSAGERPPCPRPGIDSSVPLLRRELSTRPPIPFEYAESSSD
ncbi:hypothetical protein ACQI4L_11740 [Mycolicibacterium litorale]|uniref:hypothetical protein n=1 Tax=Mycolicibacterium litorale TaxID=758802 RepID=UPI003CF89643